MQNLFLFLYRIRGIVLLEFFTYDLLGRLDPCLVPPLLLEILELMLGMKN